MRIGTQLLFGAVIVLTIVSVGLVFLTQLRSQETAAIAESNPVPTAQAEIAYPPTPSPQPVRLLFGGDLMFDRNIRLRMQEFGVRHPLAQLTEFFSRYDAVIANLEGPVTDNLSRSVGSQPGSTNNFFFTFQPEIVPMLKENNLTVLNLGNNHITNFGTDGIVQTKRYLSEAGIAYFGNTGQEKLANERVLFKRFGEHTIAFVNLNQFTAQGFETAVADTVYASQSADIVIVMPHWGEEYTPEPNRVIREQAHQLVDAGADAIVGGHPHVIQSWEDYMGKRIYYSLGNFVFDQYFQPEVKKGWLVEMHIWQNGQLQYKEIPIRLETDGRTVLEGN